MLILSSMLLLITVLHLTSLLPAHYVRHDMLLHSNMPNATNACTVSAMLSPSVEELCGAASSVPELTLNLLDSACLSAR